MFGLFIEYRWKIALSMAALAITLLLVGLLMNFDYYDGSGDSHTDSVWSILKKLDTNLFNLKYVTYNQYDNNGQITSSVAIEEYTTLRSVAVAGFSFVIITIVIFLFNYAYGYFHVNDYINYVHEYAHENEGEDETLAQSPKTTEQVPTTTEKSPTTTRQVPIEIKKLMAKEKVFGDENAQKYIDQVEKIPFGIFTKAEVDLHIIQKTLDAKHFGLNQAKNRILTQIAVIMNSPEMASNGIICLDGPPGVGKTSLVQSVGAALNRKVAIISCGGLTNADDLKGHNRGYVGSAPGEIIKALQRCESMNPIILLDEIDKIGDGGSRSSAADELLEILDPVQNCRFIDKYLDFEIDLSKIMFFATSNDQKRISAPLLSRMKVIELDDYSQEEKLYIIKHFLIPDCRKEYRLPEVAFTDQAVQWIAQRHHHKLGIREIKNMTHDIFARIVFLKLKTGEPLANWTVTHDNITELLK